MSEAQQGKTASLHHRSRLYMIVSLGFVVLLLLGYSVAYFVLPRSIKLAYQEKHCDMVLKLHDVYSSMYPSFVANKQLPNLVRECAVYTLAVTNEEKKAWLDSYNAFHVYSETYPTGLFLREAHEHSAVNLVGLARDELNQKQYGDAVNNIHLVLTDYQDTRVAPDGFGLLPEVYTAWGSDLRTANDFKGAERVFNDFKTWSQNAAKPEHINTAQREMAQTYLDWGLALQSQKQFEEAKIKLDMAEATDPNPLATSGPASRVAANQGTFYHEWGDYLVEQKDFASAMEHFDTALSLLEGDDELAIRDSVANGYIQWAADLSLHEDFLGALKQIDLAEKNAATDTMKKTTENARANTYLAFSQSSGEQAQQAMKDAVELICKQSLPPKLPIFGLNVDTHLAGFYGNDQPLPETIAAQTPGEMHYVACLDDVVSKTIQFVEFYGFQMFRFKESWMISLRNAATGELVEEYQLEGDDPDPMPTDPYAIAQGGKVQRYFGRPDMEYLAAWLLTVMK